MSIHNIYNHKLIEFICQKRCDLSNSNLYNIDENLFIFTHLEVLDLSENFLLNIPTDIQKLENLKSLILSDNQIEKLPEEIGKLIQLENLYLSGNNLTNLPKNIIQLRNLKWLSLTDNKRLVLTCEQKIWLNDLSIKGCKIFSFQTIVNLPIESKTQNPK